MELAANFFNNAVGGVADGIHSEGGEDEGEAGADEKTDEDCGVHDAHIDFGFCNTDGFKFRDIGGDEGQSGEGGGTDGKAFSGGSGGVAEGIEGIGAVANFGLKAGHFGDAAGVIGDGAVGVGGEGDAEGREHANGGKGDTVEAVAGTGETAGGAEGNEDGGADDDYGQGRGEHAKANTADDEGGGAGLGFFSKVLGGVVGVRGEVFGADTDEDTGDEAGEDGGVKAHAIAAEDEVNQGDGGDGYNNGGGVGAAAEGT